MNLSKLSGWWLRLGVSIERIKPGHPEYGLPWEQDRLVPVFLATLAIRQQSQTISFASAAEMLDTFGMQQGGAQHRKLIEASSE